MDSHLEVLRPVRSINHPALQGGEDPEILAMKKEFEVKMPFQYQPSALSSNPLDLTQMYPQVGDYKLYYYNINIKITIDFARRKIV